MVFLCISKASPESRPFGSPKRFSRGKQWTIVNRNQEMLCMYTAQSFYCVIVLVWVVLKKLLLLTEVLTTWVEVIFIVNWLVLVKQKQSCFAPFSKRFASTPIVFPHPLYNANQERRHMVVSVWILALGWSGARSCLCWWHHRFQIALFSPSTLENSSFKTRRFQIAPLWRAFSNVSVFFGGHIRRCSVDDSHIQSKTALFSFEKGLVWMGPN